METDTLTLKDYLEVVLEHTPEVLVSLEYRKQILNIGASLPPLNHGIIELCETPYASRVDLMVGVVGSEQSVRLANWLSRSNSKGSTAWKALHDFCKSWTTRGQLLQGLVSNIYLVFDNAVPVSIIPNPWIYMAFHNLRLNAETLYELHLKATGFIPGEIGSNTKKLLLSCFQALESPAWIFGFGFLQARCRDDLRIGICGFRSVQEIIAFLKRIDWPGDLREFKDSIAFTQDVANSYVLALGLGETVQPLIGIECELPKQGNRASAGKLITAVKQHFPYDPEREQAILSWMGEETHTFGINKLRSTRWLNHIKLTYEPGQLLTVKPYLYYDFIQAD